MENRISDWNLVFHSDVVDKSKIKYTEKEKSVKVVSKKTNDKIIWLIVSNKVKIKLTIGFNYLKNFGRLTIHLNVPMALPVCTCCLGLIKNNGPFIFKHHSLQNKLCDHPGHWWSWQWQFQWKSMSENLIGVYIRI